MIISLYQILFVLIIMALDPTSQFLALIEHKRHKLIKYIDAQSNIRTQKIYTFVGTDEKKIQIYREHFENVKQWHKMRYSGQSILKTIGQYDIEQIKYKQNDNDKNMYFKINRKYIEYLNLEQYYNRVEQKKIRSIKKKEVSYIYMFQEFLSVIWRGGGINNFFYSPRNIFIFYNYDNNKQQDTNFDEPKLEVNNLSSVGLELLFLKDGSILRQDLLQIYPLLPPNLFFLMKDKTTYKRQLNRLIRLRAFGWLIFTFIIRSVKNILVLQTLQVVVDSKKVQQVLNKSKQRFQVLFQVQKFSKQIKQIQNLTGIQIQKILKQIFLQNCSDLTWNTIYKTFFIKNKINQTIHQQKYKSKFDKKQKDYRPNEKNTNLQKQQIKQIQRYNRQYLQMSEIIIKDLWMIQTNQQFYLERCIQPQSMLYLLVKININFHHILKYSNLMEFILWENFSEDLTTASSFMMSQFSQKYKTVEGLSKRNCLNFCNVSQIKSPFTFNKDGVMFRSDSHVPHMIYLKNFTFIIKKQDEDMTTGKKNKQFDVYTAHPNNEIILAMFNSFV